MMKTSRLILTLSGLVLLVAAAMAPARAAEQRTFASPEQAFEALLGDLRSDNVKDLLAIFGPAVLPVLDSGDPVSDRSARERFVAAYSAKHRFIEADGAVTVIMGDEDWPFPIPLKKVGDAWRFDTAAGIEELIDRRVGRNELAMVDIALAYYDAQHDYADLMLQRKGSAEYARRIVSSPGKKDGLYWPTASGEEASPLGPRFAAARREGYAGTGEPFHGYFFKVLAAQGEHADGGALDYVVNGRMIGGFGLVAWPANYGVTGVMSFIINHDGVVYEKNLGRQTDSIARAMTRFDPDSSWRKIGP